MSDFEGPVSLKQCYEQIVEDIPAAYKEGKRARFQGGHGVGKMIDLNTEFPTPKGFVKLIDLKEGDQLFDENGNICNITKLHPIDLSPESYQITFDDGTIVNACSDHLWLTYTLNDRRKDYANISSENRIKLRRSLGLKKRPCSESNIIIAAVSRVKTTKDILNTLKVKNGISYTANHSIKCAAPLQYNKQNLLIDPYVLGCWFGGGDSYTSWLECADQEILDNIKLAGYSINLIPSSVGKSKSCTYRIGDLVESSEDISPIGLLKKQLIEFGLLRNKHIPKEYLIASYDQRLALLQGLMDTYGTCDKDGGVEFCSVTEDLANGVRDLVCSFGIKANVKRCNDRYIVTFSTALPVFRLQRKLEIFSNEKIQLRRTTHRYIVAVEHISPVPMRCITVDSPSHLYLITRSCIPTHNTMTANCILKRVLETDKYSALYVNLTDIIHVMLTSSSDIKVQARNILVDIDFLVIDELDTRFMATENAADLFGRILEPIMRTRIQNRLPLFFCTNSLKVEDSFSGPLKASIESLMNLVKLVPIVNAEDARVKIKKGKL